MIRLVRNRVTVLALPIIFLYLCICFFLLQLPGIDANTFLTITFCLILLLLVFLLFLRRRYPLNFWSMYIFSEPYNARFRNQRATAYLSCGYYEQALRDYDTGIQLRPRAKILASLYNGRSALLVHMGRYEEALQEATRSLELNSSKLVTVAAHNNRGYAYQQLFVYDAAIREYEEAIHVIRLVTAMAHLNRGLIFAAQGNYQLALQEENASVQRRPRSPLGYTNRAIVHLKFCQYQQALEDTNKALTYCRSTLCLLTRRGGSYPYAAHVYAVRALAHKGLHNYDAALADARKAVELAPVYGPNFTTLGQVYLAMRDLSQARQAFQQGIEADPKEVSNAVLLAWTDMSTTLPTAEQAPFLSEAASRYPESEWGHLGRGIAAWLREDYANARAYLDHARELDVTNPHAYFWLGMLHAAVNEDDLAQGAMQQALQFGLAPTLLTPVRVFEQQRPDFYHATLQPLLLQ